MKYRIDNKIMRWPLIIGTIIFIMLLINEGTGIITKSGKIECPIDAFIPCSNPDYDLMCIGEDCKEEFIIQGETYYISHQGNKYTKAFNISIWIMIFTAILINHYKHNKGYPFRKEIKKIIDRLSLQIDP